jgi:hypothetical protein
LFENLTDLISFFFVDYEHEPTPSLSRKARSFSVDVAVTPLKTKTRNSSLSTINFKNQTVLRKEVSFMLKNENKTETKTKNIYLKLAAPSCEKLLSYLSLLKVFS